MTNNARILLKPYLTKITESARRGDAREESFYPALESMINEFARVYNKKGTFVTVLPKKTDAGNPDFRIWDGKRRIIGYIEAKEPRKDLDEIEKTEQIKRYNTTFPNFILTNFIEFRLYRNGQCVDNVAVSDGTAIYDSRKSLVVRGEDNFVRLLEKFFSFSEPSITTPEVLAIELAKRTRFLRDEVIAQQIKEEEETGSKKILGFHDAFQTYLIRGLTKEQFADLYSQTITYGLFASRMRMTGDFSRRLAVYDIPRTIGILRDIFEFISLGDIPKQMEWIVDDIADVLANVDAKKIFSEYFRTRRGEDPVFHFYETFLAEYDPQVREQRGVYYTPEPIVTYIVSSLQSILKDDFQIADGLAGNNVTLLDPAGGTLTFLMQAIKEATNEFTSKYGEGGRPRFIKEHLLRDFYAFELLIAPYAIGHLKMSFLLEEMGYKLEEGERFKYYLTNTLEMEDINQTSLPGTASLSEESRLAGAVKKKTPILLILGNPPYSGHSENTGEWISEEIKEYYKVDGEPLQEKNTKWLQDDYVKFIRFAQWKINQTGNGVLGFITNHGYLDSPIFRGMRQSLLKSFDDSYILNLHGNSYQKERAPDGSKDENVFDIQQGVAIAIYVKRNAQSELGRIRYADLWGLRANKYEWLSKNNVRTTKWEFLRPTSPEYLFVPRDESTLKRYEKYPSINEIFVVGSVAVQTHRDNLVVDFEKDRLEERIRTFRDNSISDDSILRDFNLRETNAWRIREKRQKVKDDKNWALKILRFCFHPFDVRWIFYHDQLIDRDRWQVMQHMLIPGNIAMNCAREFAYEVNSYNYALVSKWITNDRVFVSNKGAAYLFPLYVLQDKRKERNIELPDKVKKKPNINPYIFENLQKVFKQRPIPEEVFYYVYAVLYSEVYRKRYVEFLKTNFPRIPFTSDHELFKKISDLGRELAEIHLMESEGKLGRFVARYEGEGDNIVENPRYDDITKKVYVNDSQFFEGIKKEVWSYQIGGYQIMAQWLKDRKSRTLSLDEIRQYCKIATAISRTITIQERIDEEYSILERNVIKFEKSALSASLTDFS